MKTAQLIPHSFSKATLLLQTSIIGVLFFVFLTTAAEAASLAVSPATGVYQAGGTFTLSVVVDTEGKPINAADATLSFNPNELAVVSVNRAGSIFNLWVTEPTFSNTAGTISFSGGLPSGYTGARGNVMNVTFQTKGSGSSRVQFKTGSVLANDGRGTNVLTSMNGGNYTIQARSAAPEPEVIEYIAPANTPSAPRVSSVTHNDPSAWHQAAEAKLSWILPADVIAVRTLLDDRPTSVPTKVYETPIDNITLSDLEQGESYFHVQFKNADGWGKVTHYRLAVDSQNPTSIDISQPEGVNAANPEQSIVVTVKDETSDVRRFKVKVDAAEPFDFIDETGSSTILLPSLEPGYHTVIVEAFDQAGNSIVGTYSFTIESFAKPVFTEYPTQMNEEVIPVIMGETRPNATVSVSLQKVGAEPVYYTVVSDIDGVFTFIPEGTLSVGVYELSARATDEFGAESELSDIIRIAVQQPGFLRIGGLIVSVLSVVVPLVILLLALVLGFWYLVLRILRLRKRVRTESVEALQILEKEFANLHQTLQLSASHMAEARRGKKLTKSEMDFVADLERSLVVSKERVRKEIEDVSDLVSQPSE